LGTSGTLTSTVWAVWLIQSSTAFFTRETLTRSSHSIRVDERVRAGEISYREDILEGIEQAPDSIAGLYRGENLGKRLIRIAPEPPA
jgi:NADPH-dependent curcumin reductase CurA